MAVAVLVCRRAKQLLVLAVVEQRVPANVGSREFYAFRDQHRGCSASYNLIIVETMSKTDRILRYAIGLLMCVFVYVIFLTLHERITQVGDSAPEFSVTADNGRTVSLNSFGGKVLVLNFWATWCATCMEELPSLDQFQRDFASSGVVVLGVSVDKEIGRAHV